MTLIKALSMMHTELKKVKKTPHGIEENLNKLCTHTEAKIYADVPKNINDSIAVH